MIYKSSTEKIKGMTIAELMISLGIFSLVATTSVGLFVQIIRTSRLINERSTAIDTLSLVVEQIAREIRTGKEFSGVSPTTTSTTNKLEFKNYLNEIVTYEFDATAGRLSRNGTTITPNNLKIEGSFVITNFSADANEKTTPRVLVFAVVKNNKDQILARAQTTVGARLIYYK